MKKKFEISNKIESIRRIPMRTRAFAGKTVVLSVAVMIIALFFCGCSEPLVKSRAEKTAVGELLPEAERIIVEGLADDNPRVRSNAIEAAADTNQVKMMPKVQQLLKDKFVPVRFAAALAAGDMEYALAKRSVKELLKDPDENVRIAAGYAIGKLGERQGFELIVNSIASKDMTVRANAVSLLGKSGTRGDKKALRPLDWALRDKDSDDKVRYLATEATAMLGDEQVYPKLWAMLINLYADVRVMGVRGMGSLGTVEARNALITMLDDDIPEVRLAAAEQLGMHGDNTGESKVVEVFTKRLTTDLDQDERERVYVLTALAIGQIRTKPVTKFLPQLLKDESKFVRIAAAKAVFQCVNRN